MLENILGTGENAGYHWPYTTANSMGMDKSMINLH